MVKLGKYGHYIINKPMCHTVVCFFCRPQISVFYNRLLSSLLSLASDSEIIAIECSHSKKLCFERYEVDSG